MKNQPKPDLVITGVKETNLGILALAMVSSDDLTIRELCIALSSLQKSVLERQDAALRKLGYSEANQPADDLTKNYTMGELRKSEQADIKKSPVTFMGKAGQA